MRRFNRFYTQRSGLLQDGHLESPFSLTEVRVLFELSTRSEPSAADLCRDLGLDPGYLSRLLRGFAQRGLVTRSRAPDDGRRTLLALTARGRATFEKLDAAASRSVAASLQGLGESDRQRLVDAMGAIERILAREGPSPAPYLLRPPRAGDLGWVVQRHGALYAEEYGWDEQFEALVASIVAAFGKEHDPRRERCWIAERDGAPVGSVFLMQHSRTVAKLRLLLVEPSARGLGIGRRLVDECVAFARQAGYRKVTLWTNDVLRSARKIYQASGFERVKREPHRSFGHDLVGETWELGL